MQIRRNVTGRLAALAPQVMTTPSGSPPDPELAALTVQAVAEDAARLLLDDPDRYPIERLMTHAEWLIGRLGIGAG